MKKIFVTSLVVLTLIAIWQMRGSEPIFEPSLVANFQSRTPILDPAASRKIETGEVAGFADAYDTYAWLGLPYAAPPVGDLRWRAPRSPAPWTGVRAANEYGPPCVQFWGILAETGGEEGDVVGSEDCLTLNVWAPKKASQEQAKPVMVWIHGGGNDSGTARTYQAHHLAGSQDLVVVTINYRLGLLGWLSHDAIRDTASNPEDASGNFGTLDIIAALQWVQNNIAQFGGDPNNVTVFGESAGGKNVYSLLASPLAKGLFHRAIAQSGSADTTPRTLAEEYSSKPDGPPISGLINSSNGLMLSILQRENPAASEPDLKTLLANMTAQELMAKMRNYSATDLMRWASENLNEIGETRVARVIRDGHVIPELSLFQLFKSPENYNAVPLMLGSNRDEQKLFQSGDPEFVDLKFGVLPRIKDAARYERVSQYISDNWKAQAVDEPARLITVNEGQPVYAYRFDWDESPSNWLADLPTLLGAAHGLEISFVFGDFRGGVPLGQLINADNAAGRRELSLKMMSYWGKFAHSGNPGSGRDGLNPLWQPWRPSGDNLMVFDTSADGGTRMADIRTRVAQIKQRIPIDKILTSQEEHCEAYAVLFLHGYMATDFWDLEEYKLLGCDAYPALQFRQG